jgi:hypothetical protein
VTRIMPTLVWFSYFITFTLYGVGFNALLWSDLVCANDSYRRCLISSIVGNFWQIWKKMQKYGFLFYEL